MPASEIGRSLISTIWDEFTISWTHPFGFCISFIKNEFINVNDEMTVYIKYDIILMWYFIV